ncbi:MAG: ATP-binding protein, partial [Microthrixaceae bacterium]
VGEGVESDIVASRIDEASQNWAAEVQPAAAYLKWLLGVDVSALEGLDPMELRAGVFEALVATVRDLASRSPMVITVEDLHWADESSLAALRALAQSIGDVPVLLVATTRPDGGGSLGELQWSSVLALETLSREDTVGLVEGAVAGPLSAGAASLVAERSGGNPLFVEELTAALLEAGVLVSIDGEIAVGEDPDPAGLPATLHDVVLARIDHLDGDARDALQLASVIGREFTWRILDRIASTPSGLDEHLGELESLELIRQQAWFPELAYLFKHAVVHEVTYSTLLDERRRTLHEVVALATEELYSNQLNEHCESLARHWLAAGDELRALPHLARAAERAMAGSSMDRARDALAHAALIAESSGDGEAALDYRLLRMQVLIVGDDMNEAVAEVDRAVVLAEAIGPPEKRAMLHWWKANALQSAHEFEECEREARAGIALAESLGDAGTEMMVACSSALGSCLGVLGRLDEFDEIESRVEPLRSGVSVDLSVDGRIMAGLVANWRAEWSQELIDAVSEPVSSAWTRVLALWESGLSYAGMGCYADALDRLELALVEAVRVDFEFGRGRILNTLGWIHGELGDPAGAAPLNRESLEVALALAHPDIEIEANARLNLADDGLRAGDADTAVVHVEALRRVVQAPTPYERFGHWRFSMRWRCVLAQIELARGNPEAALHAAQRCLDDAENKGARKYEVRARRHLGDAQAMLGAPGPARQELDAAVALAEEIGNPPQLWRSLLAVARLGDRDAARRAVETIEDVVKSLGDRPLATSLADSRERREAAALTQH